MRLERDAGRIIRGLIDVCDAGARGFSRCAARVRRPALKQFFEIRANGCQDASQSLAAVLGDTCDSDPVRDASVPGGGGQGWPDGRASGPGDELSVLQECEAGEDYALIRYEEALQADLPETVREVVASQCEGVRRNHAQVRALRDRAQADRDAGRDATGQG